MTVQDSEGGKLTQKELNAFLSSFTIDPLYISRLKPKNQIEVIKEIAGIDTTEVEEEAKELYDKRTIENRELKRLEGVLTGFKGVQKVDSVDITKLLKEKEEKEEENREHYNQEVFISTEKGKVQETEERIEKLKEELKREEGNLEIYKTNVEGAEKKLEKMSKHDLTELTESITNAESTNANARKWSDKQTAFKAVQTQTEVCNDIDTSYKEKLAEREAIIANSDIPEYITFDKEEGVLVSGIPFSQLNTAQQIEVSIKLASILTPELKVLHIKDGSLLDLDSLELVRKTVEVSGYQMLVERVGEEEVDTIVMKEGVKVK